MSTITASITTTVSAIPLLRHRDTVVTPSDQDDFVTKYEATNDHLSNITVSELNAIGNEIDVVTAQINTVAGEVNANASIATAAATTAQSTANASLWVSGQAYTAGQSSISPINFQTYRANTSTSGTTDPSLSADWTAIQATDATKLPLAGGTMTGAITSLRETSVAMTANDIDMSLGNYFTKTISTATTLTVSNIPTTGQVGYFILELTNGGAGTVTYPTGTKFPKGTAPTLTASGIDLLRFVTRDGGTTWRATRIDEDSK